MSSVNIESTLGIADIAYYDARLEPFRVYGLYNCKTERPFRRLPDEVAKATNDGVAGLALNTAGGRVRFRTDSDYVAIKAVMHSIGYMPHFALSGSTGFDLYINKSGRSVYYRTFMPTIGMKDGYESVIYFPGGSERDITINFPLYSGVIDLYIGLKKSASLGSGSEYKYKTPVLYYGSSITQGGCASRPGNSYEAIISVALDCDYINLGFSGSARGEDSIIDYMSGIDMSVFVCDYDHNSPSVEHLMNTHEKLYKKFRGRKPELPIILVSKPDFDNDIPSSIHRRDVIYRTYINAINSGDKNVYYIDGQSLFKDEGRDNCTVDGCHPNDLGFMRMAEVIGGVVKRILM